ncbi:excalibur calcium-binding domain-containing protein [Pseudoclavibacter sp. VKM Ac-2888]|nr:excalibur calcium-binding domain-containing protein [Pseudoclavibacter sp. VKM Ac-2888]
MNSGRICSPGLPRSPPSLEPLIVHSPRAPKSRLPRHTLLAAAAALSIVAFGVLSGCASASEPVAEPAPTVTVTATATLPVETVTVTVTATPEVVVPAEEVSVPEAAPAAPEPAPEPETAPVPLAAEPVEQPSNVYYKNCTAARDAGAAPVYSGDPGYGPHLDRDGDGIGCE